MCYSHRGDRNKEGDLSLPTPCERPYSQPEVAHVLIENKAAIDAYSLVQNKVVQITAANEFEK